MQKAVEPHERVSIEAQKGFHLCLEIAQFDAIATFSNNVVDISGNSRPPNFIPTGYTNTEQVSFVRDREKIEMAVFCGGQARVLATAMLGVCLGEDMPSVAFVGGKETGGVYRSEAAIYHKSYIGKVRQLRDKHRCTAYRANSLPHDFGRESVLYGSQNSWADIEHLVRTARQRGWKSIAAITNRYHAERLQRMSEETLTNPHSEGISIRCFSAEEIVCHLASAHARPIYEGLIETAYRQATAHNRARLERIGIEMLNRGTYQSGNSRKDVA